MSRRERVLKTIEELRLAREDCLKELKRIAEKIDEYSRDIEEWESYLR